jgi:hypothetical protein
MSCSVWRRKIQRRFGITVSLRSIYLWNSHNLECQVLLTNWDWRNDGHEYEDWDATPCRVVAVKRRSRRSCCLHHHQCRVYCITSILQYFEIRCPASYRRFGVAFCLHIQSNIKKRRVDNFFFILSGSWLGHQLTEGFVVFFSFLRLLQHCPELAELADPAPYHFAPATSTNLTVSSRCKYIVPSLSLHLKSFCPSQSPSVIRTPPPFCAVSDPTATLQLTSGGQCYPMCARHVSIYN